MHILDLTELPKAHPPSPYPFPPPHQKKGIWGSLKTPEDDNLIAVGWLGDRIPTTGDIPPAALKKLFRAHNAKRWVTDGTAGWHDCELCQGNENWYPGGKVGPVVRWRWIRRRVRGYGHFLVRRSHNVFMAPVLVLHYIVDHGYRPPDVFIAAVLKGQFLTAEDLIWEGPPSA